MSDAVRPVIGSGVSCLSPVPLARAVITKPRSGHTGRVATEEHLRPVLRPHRVPVGLGAGHDDGLHAGARIVVKMSPSRDITTRPFPAGPKSGGGFGRVAASTRPAASAASRSSRTTTGRHGHLRHRRAVGRSRASGATFQGWSRPTAGSCERSARRGRRSSRGSAARRGPRGAPGARVRSGRSTSCELPSGESAGRVGHRVRRDRRRASRRASDGDGTWRSRAGCPGSLATSGSGIPRK